VTTSCYTRWSIGQRKAPLWLPVTIFSARVYFVFSVGYVQYAIVPEFLHICSDNTVACVESWNSRLSRVVAMFFVSELIWHVQLPIGSQHAMLASPRVTPALVSFAYDSQCLRSLGWPTARGTCARLWNCRAIYRLGLLHAAAAGPAVQFKPAAVAAHHVYVLSAMVRTLSSRVTVSCHRILGERRTEVIGRTWCR